MLISEIDGLEFGPEQADLLGKRVLVTGIRGALGADIARAFGEARTRLILHAQEDGPETTALASMIAESALDLRLYSGPFQDRDGMRRFARSAAQCYGGLDAVINLAHVGEPPPAAGPDEIEQIVADALALATIVTQVAANRMRAALAEGTILNIVTGGRRASPAGDALAGFARSALAGLTVSEARALADDGIRINAIAPAQGSLPPAGGISAAPDVASVAMHLVGSRGSHLSGLIFEAYFG